MPVNKMHRIHTIKIAINLKFDTAKILKHFCIWKVSLYVEMLIYCIKGRKGGVDYGNAECRKYYAKSKCMHMHMWQIRHTLQLRLHADK